MTDTSSPLAPADAPRIVPAPRRLAWVALRLAWHGRALWHRIARPLTMGVRAIILDGPENARCVLLIRHSYVGGWHLPGGGVNRGETVAAALRREVREEVGLRVDGRLRLFGVYARFVAGASDHVSVFVAEGWSGTPTADGVEIVEARFFPLASLPPDMSRGTRRRLDELAGAPRAEEW